MTDPTERFSGTATAYSCCKGCHQPFMLVRATQQRCKSS